MDRKPPRCVLRRRTVRRVLLAGTRGDSYAVLGDSESGVHLRYQLRHLASRWIRPRCGLGAPVGDVSCGSELPTALSLFLAVVGAVVSHIPEPAVVLLLPLVVLAAAWWSPPGTHVNHGLVTVWTGDAGAHSSAVPAHVLPGVHLWTHGGRIALYPLAIDALANPGSRIPHRANRFRSSSYFFHSNSTPMIRCL